MTREQIVAFVQRDWVGAETAQLADWREQRRVMPDDQALAIGSALWQQVRRLRPDWPSGSDREADFAAHVELSRRLRRVDLRPGR